MANAIVQPRVLGDNDYDQNGRPAGVLTVSWQSYDLALGPQSCWLAAFDHLPGYFGEGDTIENALERLWQSLGPKPHYQVNHAFRSPKKLKADIERNHKAMAVAALTRARRWGRDLGGGDGVDSTAKQFGVGKPAVNAARSELSAVIDSKPGERIGGLNAEALATSAGLANDRMGLELWVARETPWRSEHAAARKLFPSKIAD